MPKITALIHASNNERCLGRALDSLRPCDEVIVVAVLGYGTTFPQIHTSNGHGFTMNNLAREHRA